jgi:transcriptional regulator with XRE-family HTH domain
MWRDEAGLTLQKLGERAGVSASTIHKIENLQTVPTIAVLLKVSNGLNRRPAELLEDVDGDQYAAVMRKDDRPRISVSPHVKLEHLVAMIPHSEIDVWRGWLAPGRGAGRPGTDPWKFRGEWVLFVEEGCLEAEIAGEKYTLEVGDSIHFDTDHPHRLLAARDAPARVIVIAHMKEQRHLRDELVARAVPWTDGDLDVAPESESEPVAPTVGTAAS